MALETTPASPDNTQDSDKARSDEPVSDIVENNDIVNDGEDQQDDNEDSLDVITPTLVDQDLLTFSQRINASLQTNLPQTAQSATAEILNLLPEIDQNTPTQVFRNVQIAFTALTQNPPQMALAQQIIKDIRTLLKPTYSLFGHSVPPTGIVIMGMIAMLATCLPVLILVHFLLKSSYPSFFGEPVILVLAVMLAGILGSCVSIMVRINDFQGLARSNVWVLFFNGFFKPIIGLSFALFLFAVITSGIIPIAIQTGVNDETTGTFNNSEALFILAVSFICGFSERFAKDIASKVEEKVVSNVR